MSFNIYVSGLTGGITGGGRGSFRYSKDNCVDQGDFEPPALLAMVPSSPTASGVVEKVAGTPESHVTDGVLKAMTKVAEIELAHMVRTGVDMLAMRGNGGEISVYCVQESWFWGTTNSYVTFKFNGSYEPGRDFLKKISPGLVKTELNNFGVLRQISNALNQYHKELPGSGSPYLSISLSH
jgi:hypothetical protein